MSVVLTEILVNIDAKVKQDFRPFGFVCKDQSDQSQFLSFRLLSFGNKTGNKQDMLHIKVDVNSVYKCIIHVSTRYTISVVGYLFTVDCL